VPACDRSRRGCLDFLSWKQSKTTTMEIDGYLVVFAIAKSAGHVLDHLDLAVDAFHCRIGDMVLEAGQYIIEMAVQGLAGLDGCPQIS